MNKFGMVLGLAAVATLAGCKDPDYKSDRNKISQNEVKSVDTTPAPSQDKPSEIKTITIEPVTQKCTCPPGTKHTEPCKCGAPDCKCVVETTPVITADLSAKPAEPEYTVYIVQNGDYLAKISKKFNVTINSIKRLNPSIKGDVILVGQKLKIPGKVDVGVQEAPKTWTATKTTSASGKKTFAPYVGATKEYVVKNGDTLGAVAYGNGITIRQLKDLNGLTSDSLKVGQKLKIPVEKGVKPVAKTTVAAKPVAKAAVAAKPAATVKKDAEQSAPASTVDEVKAAEEALATEAEPKTPEASAADSEAAAPVAVEAAKQAAPATTTYIVQEGDDMTGVSIRWGVSAADIRELNNLGENDQLVPGQAIKLPADAQQ